MGVLKSLRKSVSTKKDKKDEKAGKKAPSKKGPAPPPKPDEDELKVSLTGSHKVEIPTGKIGLSFKGQPPAITQIEDSSPLADKVKVGQIICGLSVPDEPGTFSVSSVALAKALGASSETEGRMLVLKNPPGMEAAEDDEATAGTSEDAEEKVSPEEKADEEEKPVPPVVPAEDDAKDDSDAEKENDEPGPPAGPADDKSEKEDDDAPAEKEEEPEPEPEPEKAEEPKHDEAPDNFGKMRDGSNLEEEAAAEKTEKEDEAEEAAKNASYGCCGFGST